MRSRAGITLLSLLIVLSFVLPMSIPVSASDTTPSTATRDGLISEGFNSGSDYWQGYHLQFDGSQIVTNPSSASTAERTFQVRSVAGGEVGGLVDEFTIDENGTGVIDTSAMSGRLIIQYQGDNVFIEAGTGFLSAPSGGPPSVDQSAWRVRPQTYSSSWSDPTVYPGEFTTLTLTSNRKAETTVAVSADQLSFDDLITLFSSDAFAENFGARASDDVLILEASGRRDYQLAATGLSPGTYNLHFETTDTAADHTTTLEVKKGGKFDTLERGEEVGDLVHARINCTDCYLVAGGADEGFVDLVELSDGNGDGVVDLTINTRYMGIQPSASGVSTTVEPYSSSTDSVDQLSPSYRLTTRSSQDQLGTLRTDLGLNAQGRSAPVASGPVDLTVASSDFLMARSQYGDHRAPLGGQLVVRDEQDVSTIDLRDPVLGKVETYAQPARFGIDRNLTEVTNRLPPVKQVALGDELIVRIDITGIHGYLDTTGSDLSAISDNGNEGIDLKVGRTAGRPGIPIDLRANSMDIAEEHDRLYVAIDTSRNAIRQEVTLGATYTVSFTLTGIPAHAGEYDLTGTEEQSQGYPYLAPGETKRVETTVKFVEPTAAVTTTAETLKVSNQNPVTIGGTSNLAPDSVIAVTAAGPWEKSTSATIRPDGTWRATFDFSNTKIGDSFTVSVKQDSSVLTQSSGAIVAPSAVPDGTTPTTPVAADPDGSPPDGTSSSSTNDGRTMTDSGNSNDGPGSSDSDAGGGLFGFVPSGLANSSLSGFILPIAAIMGIFGLIALVIGRLR